MEPSATTAVWEGDRLTLYDATQWVSGAANVVAKMLGIPGENVRVVSYFLGGGFGCKGFTWPHTVLAALAARQVRRPVTLALTRSQMFTSVGYRAETQQRVELGAERDGALNSILHISTNLTSPYDGVFSAGHILNAKTGRSQLMGGIVFGIGMALMEQTVMDQRYGRIVNDDLSEYLVPVNRDVPAIQIFTVDEEDPHVNLIGVKGIGEIGVVGSGAAIANAVFHATGKRIRELPITPDKLLA